MFFGSNLPVATAELYIECLEGLSQFSCNHMCFLFLLWFESKRMRTIFGSEHHINSGVWYCSLSINFKLYRYFFFLFLSIISNNSLSDRCIIKINLNTVDSSSIVFFTTLEGKGSPLKCDALMMRSLSTNILPILSAIPRKVYSPV